MTNTVPLRRTIEHASQYFLTALRTFMPRSNAGESPAVAAGGEEWEQEEEEEGVGRAGVVEWEMRVEKGRAGFVMDEVELVRGAQRAQEHEFG